MNTKEDSQHKGFSSGEESWAKMFVNALGDLKAAKDPNSTNDKLTIIGSLLEENSHITGFFKRHFREMIKDFVESGLLELSGYKWVLREAGIDLPNNRLGIFDHSQAKAVEKRAIQFWSGDHSIFLPEFKKEHSQQMEEWVNDYEDKYGEDPL